MPLIFGNGPKRPAELVDASGVVSRFLEALPADEGSNHAGGERWKASDTRQLLGEDDAPFTALMHVARTSHASGLLRFLLPETRPSLIDWNRPEGWHSDWPSLPAAVAIASDWKGNLLLLDPTPASRRGRKFAFLEIATGEYVALEENFEQMMGDIMPGHWQSLLSQDYYERWLAVGGRRVAPNECVFPKVLPALGGDPDDVASCLTIDLMVAVSIAGQLHEQTRNLPPGYKISGLRFVPR